MALMGKHRQRRAMRGIPTPDVSFASAAGLPAVYLRGGSKSEGGVELLSDVLLTINRGEVVSVVSPSNDSLRALLRCLALLDPFDKGTLAYGALQVTSRGEDGRAVYDMEASRDAHARFGVVFEDFNLFPHLSVLRNICDAPVAVRGRSKEEAQTKAHELLARFDLTDCADLPPRELSSWQLFKVALCRALIMKPKVIFFGEVTRYLDPQQAGEAFELMGSLAADGLGVGILTGEANLACRVSSRILVLLEGKVVDEGTPQEVIIDPRDERVREYLAQQGNRFLRATLDRRVLL